MSKVIMIFIFILVNLNKCEQLIFVATHFRHGARAPMEVDSNYKDHIKEEWTNPGELTGVGQRMHYILGLRNRYRYITNTYNFLSKKFDSHEVLVYSTAFNRTILSAYAQLQGLYPEFEGLGDVIKENQEKLAVPDINFDLPNIKEKIEEIKGYAMPNLMTLIPVRMINDKEKKITLYDINECEQKRDQVKEKNRNTLPILIKMKKEFNEKYGSKLNEFYGKEETYDYVFMNRFCDGIISGLTEGRDLTEFKKTNINLDEIRDYCYDVQKMNYQEHILGDDEHILAGLESSKMLREIIHYMKKRIDIDIKQENIEKKYLDYSRPKMVMISGHDSTISCHEMFIISCLGYNNSYFRLAKYASQMALEVTRRDASLDEIEKMNYSDYTLNYYFNDELIFNIKVDEFIKKIEPNLWTDEQIDDFCGFKTDKNDENKTFFFMVFIILLSLVFIFVTSTIIMSFKYINLNKKHIRMVSQISLIERKSLNDEDE